MKRTLIPNACRRAIVEARLRFGNLDPPEVDPGCTLVIGASRPDTLHQGLVTQPSINQCCGLATPKLGVLFAVEAASSRFMTRQNGASTDDRANHQALENEIWNC
ncbi:hypothetical protein [Thiorhodovibrio winogradskyi]|uniref:hypothetical protein n=1 Tax=Thiorhodovibrio winogradskyi TaxID=77007 RepID=UPI002E2B3DB2|nr:hypothetical protein [Thiorhodovibrio winogradskyi]